jgi:hypothetical protein
LPAKEISNIRWSMVTDAEGAVSDAIHLIVLQCALTAQEQVVAQVVANFGSMSAKC